MQKAEVGKVLKVPTFTGRGGKDREERRQRRGKERGGDGPVAGGELLQGLRGIDAPVCSPYTVHAMN